jgi:hypothetical protein
MGVTVILNAILDLLTAGNVFAGAIRIPAWTKLGVRITGENSINENNYLAGV